MSIWPMTETGFALWNVRIAVHCDNRALVTFQFASNLSEPNTLEAVDKWCEGRFAKFVVIDATRAGHVASVICPVTQKEAAEMVNTICTRAKGVGQ